jgi:hypothetical protein
VEVIKVTLKPGQIYTFMQKAYLHGVLDRFVPVLGEALDGAMRETGLSMDDMMNKMDGAEEATVEKVDRFLARTGLFFQISANGLLMRLFSRLLDIHTVRRVAVNRLQRFLVSSVTK